MNAIDGETHKVLISAAAVKPNEGAPLGQAGLEWNYDNTFFLRVGRRFNYTAATYSFGAGVRATVAGLGLRADYSYADFTALGTAHRFGLGVSF
jgi:hypothetical protein